MRRKRRLQFYTLNTSFSVVVHILGPINHYVAIISAFIERYYCTMTKPSL